mgnify:CR=1 FL=1
MVIHPTVLQSNKIAFFERDWTVAHIKPVYEDLDFQAKLNSVMRVVNKQFVLVPNKLGANLAVGMFDSFAEVIPVDEILSTQTPIEKYGKYSGWCIAMVDPSLKGLPDIVGIAKPHLLSPYWLNKSKQTNMYLHFVKVEFNKCEIIHNAKRPLYEYMRDRMFIRGYERGGVDAIVFDTEDGDRVIHLLKPENSIKLMIRMDIIGVN